MKSKFVRWFRAFIGGYFWLPCPICGEPFGGNEPHGRWYQGLGSGVSTCINCAPEAGMRTSAALREEKAQELVYLATKLPEKGQ